MDAWSATLWIATLCANPAAGGTAWHLDGWRQRAVVEITTPAPDADTDTAAVRLLCQGGSQPAGEDFRVVNAAGQPLPFQIVFVDAARYALLGFQAVDPSAAYYVYWDNPQAPRSGEQIVGATTPGAGPPQGPWIPRQGMVYVTSRRPEGDNPKTVEEMAHLLATSPSQDGARWQRQVSDGFNPFGSSDYYVSAYRGWIILPKAGRYSFCTASNEASFSFLDGKPLIHWPGRHTAERGMRGEKHATVELTAGLHYLEYYHEEVLLQQMAFLGWSPPGSPDGQFDAIPESVFVAPHEAAVSAYQTTAGPALRFEPLLVDTIWPTLRYEGQYTRSQFEVLGAADGDEVTYRWDFGDGQSATGPKSEHVYLALGRYQVKLTAEGPGGARSAQWPLDVFEVQHVTDSIREGSLTDYLRLANGYDRTRLDALGLKELAHLLAEGGTPRLALTVGQEFVARYGAEKAEWLPSVRRLMADCALQLGEGGLDEAIAGYLDSLTDQTPPKERFEVLARLIRLLGIDRDAPEKAAEIVAQAQAAAKTTRLNEEGLTAFRKTIIAAGDVQLWHGKLVAARDLYRQAEKLGQPIAEQVRSAQVGAFPDLIDEFIHSADYSAALSVVDRWENNFPTDKLQGQTWYFRGKLLRLRGQPEEGARHLARAVGLGVGAAFESEARWLLAESLSQLGKPEEARRELAKILASGFRDRFADLARKKLNPKPPEKP